MIKKIALFISLLAFLFSAVPALAAWTVINGYDATLCSTCGVIESGKNSVAFRVKVIGDGTTTTAAENLLVNVSGFQGMFFYDLVIETPASGGPSGTWNLDVQDSETGKLLVNKTAIDNTGSAIIDISGNEYSGKYEKILGLPRIVSSDTDLGNTEFVYMVFTFVE